MGQCCIAKFAGKIPRETINAGAHVERGAFRFIVWIIEAGEPLHGQRLHCFWPQPWQKEGWSFVQDRSELYLSTAAVRYCAEC